MNDQERKAMEMALEVLCKVTYTSDSPMKPLIEKVTDDLSEALAQPEQEPTVPDNMQDWAKLDGVTAWHLMERHADNWADVGKMMNEFIEAKIKTAQSEQDHGFDRTASHMAGEYVDTAGGEPVAWMYVNEDGEVGDIGYGVPTVKDPYIELLYTAPQSKPWLDLSGDEISRVWHKHLWDSPSPHKDFARAIEAKLKELNNG